MDDISGANKRQRLDTVNYDDVIIEDVEVIVEPSLLIPTDTEFVISSIEHMSSKLHGFVFLHQIYATLTNRTIVDAELSDMRYKSKKFKFLNCNFLKRTHSNEGGTGSVNAMLIINTRNYVNSLSRHLITSSNGDADTNLADQELCDKFGRWLRNSTQISLFRRDLKQPQLQNEMGYGLSDAEIDRLLHAGFLQYRTHVIDDTSALTASDDSFANGRVSNSVLHGRSGSKSLHIKGSSNNSSNSGSSSSSGSGSGVSDKDQEIYWLSHPAARALVLCMQAVEQDVLSCIKKTSYKEISEKKLNTIMLKNAAKAGSGSSKTGLHTSPFPLSYHILDLEGRNVIYKVRAPATNDSILRIKS